MNRLIFRIFCITLIAALAGACTPATPQPAPSPLPTPIELPATEPSLPTQAASATAAAPTLAPSPIPTGTTAPTSSGPARPDETIFIRQPGPGSRVSSPILVAGEAGPTFEQNLVVRVLLEDGAELSLTPTTIQSETGQRGLFAVEIPVSLEGERNLFIQVYAESPRDGGITHLASTAVLFSPGGQQEIFISDPQPERIAIYQPQVAGVIRGGTAHVEGFALASFEQTLVVDVLDADGRVVGTQPVTVQAPDLGQPGPFSADVPYQVSTAGPGRIVVRDPSPAYGGDAHLSSVEVTLEP